MTWAFARLYTAFEGTCGREWRLESTGPIVLTKVRLPFYSDAAGD